MLNYQELIKHSGNRHLIEACEVALLSILKGIPFHLHAEGVRGTGKTTTLRNVKNILPKIIRVKDCEYNCHPQMPHCPKHRNMEKERLEEEGTEWIDVPFFEISHTAKPGTVAGSIDLEKLTRKDDPFPAVLPGIIPRAHRGIVFVDEINRLADTSPELADILLDVMGTKPGKLQIEETGLDKVELTVNVSVWAASNPDEDPGSLEDIRKQLSDRFDFSIPVDRPREEEVVEKILSADNVQGGAYSLVPEKGLYFKKNLEELSKQNEEWGLKKEVEKSLAQVYVKYKLESLRALKALRLGAILKSIIKGKNKGELAEIIEVTPLALKHRVDKETLYNIMSYLREEKNKENEKENNNEYDYDKNISGTKQNNKENSYGKKNFFNRLLEKLKKSSACDNSSCEKNKKAKGQKQSSNAGSGGIKSKGSLQMRPDEGNIKAPDVDAKPLNELLETDRELVKKGEEGYDNSKSAN